MSDTSRPDWIAVASGAALGDAHGRYVQAVEADIVEHAIASHECNECCGITFDPVCPLWADSVHALLRPRTDPRYAAAADRVPALAAKLVADAEFMQAARPELEALASAADLEGGLLLRLFGNAWRGASPEERQAVMASIMPDLIRMVADEAKRAAVEEVRRLFASGEVEFDLDEPSTGRRVA
jgi:hypothetical protein